MKHKHSIFPNLSLALTMKEWKSYFQNNEWKWMVCYTLNKLMDKEKIAIRGYLITDRNLMLVLMNTVDEQEQILRDISHSLRKEIERKWKQRERILHGREEFKPYFESHSIYEDDIFDHRPILNLELIHLLIGLEIEKPYEDPKTNQLEKECRTSHFCSYNEWNYGAEGPVKLIEVIYESEELFEEES